MRYHILECESQYDLGGNFLEDSSPMLSPNEPTGREQGSLTGERDSLVHLDCHCQDLQSENATLNRELDYQHAKTEQILENMERQVDRLQALLVGMGPTPKNVPFAFAINNRNIIDRRCQDLQSENATLKRELDYQHAKTEQILENMERQVDRLQELLVGMGPALGMNTRGMGKKSGRGWAQVGSIAAPILVCVIVTAALAVPASTPPWRYWNKGGTDCDRGGGTGVGGLECTLAPGPAPIQPPIDAEEAAARLTQRASDLSAALTNAFQGGSEQGSSAEAEQREAARRGIARNVIHETLLERESQLINCTRDRAAALHFAGDPKNHDWILRNFGRMTNAIERFVLRDAGLGGHAALHIDEGAWNNTRDHVAAHVSLHRQSVIVLPPAPSLCIEIVVFEIHHHLSLSLVHHHLSLSLSRPSIE
jgi:hypothetical protein